MMSARHNPTTELLIKPRTTSAIMIAGKAINISASAIMIESNHLPTIAENKTNDQSKHDCPYHECSKTKCNQATYK